MATLLESVCRNLFILFYFSKYGEFGSFIFFPKNSFVCVKIVFFRVKRMPKKKKRKKRWSTSSRVYIPFHSIPFFLGKRKQRKKKKMRIANLYTASTFHSIPFISFFRKKKEKIENHSPPKSWSLFFKKMDELGFSHVPNFDNNFLCVWHYYLQIFWYLIKLGKIIYPSDTQSQLFFSIFFHLFNKIIMGKFLVFWHKIWWILLDFWKSFPIFPYH